MRHRRKYLRGGFTLIELLIVVAIIAIVSAIAIPRIIKALYLAKDKKVMTEMRNFAVAIGIYRMDYEMIPNTSDITELVAALQESRGKEQLPINERDAWGHEFYYSPQSQDEYTLKSFGRDGGPGNPATTDGFDPNADLIIITGVFAASHQGVTAIVGK